MGWLTLILLPIVILLYFQVQFLPYHKEAVTWLHRVAILVDLSLLVLVGIFLDFPKPSLKAALVHNYAARRGRLALVVLAATATLFF